MAPPAVVFNYVYVVAPDSSKSVSDINLYHPRVDWMSGPPDNNHKAVLPPYQRDRLATSGGADLPTADNFVVLHVPGHTSNMAYHKYVWCADDESDDESKLLRNRLDAWAVFKKDRVFVVVWKAPSYLQKLHISYQCTFQAEVKAMNAFTGSLDFSMVVNTNRMSLLFLAQRMTAALSRDPAKAYSWLTADEVPIWICEYDQKLSRVCPCPQEVVDRIASANRVLAIIANKEKPQKGKTVNVKKVAQPASSSSSSATPSPKATSSPTKAKATSSSMQASPSPTKRHKGC